MRKSLYTPEQNRLRPAPSGGGHAGGGGYGDQVGPSAIFAPPGVQMNRPVMMGSGPDEFRAPLL